MEEMVRNTTPATPHKAIRQTGCGKMGTNIGGTEPIGGVQATVARLGTDGTLIWDCGIIGGR